MTVYLDELLPDEILFSVVARYVESRHIENFPKFITSLFGKSKERLDQDEFAHLVVETAAPWGMDVHEIRSRTTLYPFYSALFPGVCGHDAIRQRIQTTQWSGCVDPRRPGIRYCRACWREDEELAVPQYWRRAHQLPGVVTCVWHGDVLFATNHSSARNLMTAAVRRGGGYPIVSEGVPEIAEWHRVAKFNLRLLCGEFLPPATGVKTSRLDLLERCGYISGGKLDKERLGNDLLHRFGVEYLSVFTPIHGFVSSLQRAVLLDENRVGAPFFAMLVCYLLNHIAERFASSEDPNCPASRSCHDESHRVIQWGNGERGHHYLCACGLSFIILDDDGSGARIHPTQEGQDVALAIKILSERSYSVPRLVRMLGISQDIILKMLNGSVAILPWSRRTERAKYLAKWIDLISRCGDADAAYVARPQLYHALGKLLDVLPDILTPRDTAVSTRKRLVRGER